jgi:hypothetical protein
MTETLTLNPAGFRELDGEELFAVDGGGNILYGIAQVVGGIGFTVVGGVAIFAGYAMVMVPEPTGITKYVGYGVASAGAVSVGAGGTLIVSGIKNIFG